LANIANIHQKASAPHQFSNSFLRVQAHPFQDELLRPRREVPMHPQRLDLDGDLVLSVYGVNMGSPVFAVEHADHDAKEATEFRHRSFLSSLVSA
jgi:hypothetical protein